MVRPAAIPAVIALVLACGLCTCPAGAAETVFPSADGTLADGGIFGPRDGVVDTWNWAFGASGFAGAVTLSTETPEYAVEHRVVFEYDLRSAAPVQPLDATLTFTVRGAAASQLPEVTLHVYSYPADLIESPNDFSRGPAVLQGVIGVPAGQPPTTLTLDVSEAVTAALLSGVKRVAFRFQIDPYTPHPANQVFIDAADDEPASKPVLTIRSALPGDADDDGDVDLDDFAILADCINGPAATPQPALPGVFPADCLWAFDNDLDGDVDIEDLPAFFEAFAPR